METKTRKTVGTIGAIFVAVGTAMIVATGGDPGTYVGIGSAFAGVIINLIAAFKK